MQLHHSEEFSNTSLNPQAASSFGPLPAISADAPAPASLTDAQGGALEQEQAGHALLPSQNAQTQQAAFVSRQPQNTLDIAALLQEFRTVMRGQERRKRFRRRMTQATLASGGLTYLLFSSLGVMAANNPWWFAVLGVSIVVTLSCIALLALTWRLVLNPRQQQIATAMAGVDDVQALGPLIEAMTYEGAQVPAVRDTVTRLLYQVRPSSAGYIDRPRRTALYGLLTDTTLRDPAETELCLATLAAIEQMGDVDALPFIRSAAQRSAWTPAQRLVRDRAAECLRDWNTNLAQAQSGTSLLRATTAPTDSPDVLLRSAPVNSAGDTIGQD